MTRFASSVSHAAANVEQLVVVLLRDMFVHVFLIDQIHGRRDSASSREVLGAGSGPTKRAEIGTYSVTETAPLRSFPSRGFGRPMRSDQAAQTMEPVASAQVLRSPLVRWR